MVKILKENRIKAPSIFLREGGFSFFKLKSEGFFKLKTKLFFFLFSLFFVFQISAQCAMCRAVLESEEGQSTAEGVNDGIMYLMAIPYILVGSIGFIIYWSFFRKKKSIK